MIALSVFAMLSAQEAQPMVVLRPTPLSMPLSATSWHCNFTGADGHSFALKGRFDEIPAGAQPEEFRPTMVKAVAADRFEGPMQVRVGGILLEDVRRYTMRAAQSDGTDYTFNFQFLRTTGNYATVSHYTPPKGDKIGVVAAYANGYCSSRFHAIGEKDASK